MSTPQLPATISVFHASDLHFGHPAVPEQYEAIEELIHENRYDVVAVSGDLSQRARAGEFQRARSFLQHARRVSQVIVVPGNHDVAWWYSPLGFGNEERLLRNYRRFISEDLEPVLRVPGATIVGINTSHGVTHHTLTWRPREWSVIGHVLPRQIEHLQREFDAAPDGEARIVVMHHNPVRGELSGRHGLKDTRKILGAFADMGVDLVLCGHDHQEAIHYIEHTRRGTVISTAGTASNRVRGGRPSSVNDIRITPTQVEVSTLVWASDTRTFVQGPVKCFAR